MTIVAVEFPEPVHYIAARTRTSRAEPPGNRPNTRPRITPSAEGAARGRARGV